MLTQCVNIMTISFRQYVNNVYVITSQFEYKLICFAIWTQHIVYTMVKQWSDNVDIMLTQYGDKLCIIPGESNENGCVCGWRTSTCRTGEVSFDWFVLNDERALCTHYVRNMYTLCLYYLHIVSIVSALSYKICLHTYPCT